MDDILNTIENPETTRDLNLFSGRASLKDYIERQEWFNDLLPIAEYAPMVIRKRIAALLVTPHNPNCAHPHDNTLAVYLLALGKTHPELIEAQYIGLLNMRELFWARCIVEDFIIR